MKVISCCLYYLQGLNQLWKEGNISFPSISSTSLWRLLYWYCICHEQMIWIIIIINPYHPPSVPNCHRIATTHSLTPASSQLFSFSLEQLHQAHSLQRLHLLLHSALLAVRMSKGITTTRSQQPTCNFLWWLKTPNSFQIPTDGATSFDRPQHLPQPFTLLLEVLLLLLALLLGQARWVHAEMEHFGSAGVIVTLCGRNNRKRLSTWSSLQVHSVCITPCVKRNHIKAEKRMVRQW